MKKVKSAAKRILPQALRLQVRSWAARYRDWQYAGTAVECPFCEKTFSRFKPTGALERPFWRSEEGRALLELDYINVANAQCPGCGSGERHRLLYFYLCNRIKIFERPGLKLLDVAPDGFLWRKVFSIADLEYISIDLRPARQPTFLMDLTDLKFANDTFEAIICYHVLEHIPDDRQAMKELYRVLKPGGWALLQVPIWARERTIEDPDVPRQDYALVYGHKDHVRRYGLDYQDRLMSAGFKVTVDNYARQLPHEFSHRYGLFGTEDIYFCEKG